MNVKNNHNDIVDYFVDDVLRPSARAMLNIFSFRLKNKIKDNRIIIGVDSSNIEHHIYPEERCEHSIISGKPGTGKSLEAIKTTRQLINLNIRTCFVDPAGTAVRSIYSTVKSTDNIDYFSLNRELQGDKVLGFNPLYCVDKDTDILNQYISDIHRMIFSNSSMEIKIQGKFILESVIYFHNCYPFHLANNNVAIEKIGQIISKKQLTFTDMSLIMNNNQNIFDLFIEVLATNCEFRRVDLAVRWNSIKHEKKQQNYLIQASKRFDEFTQNVESSYFLESSGFNILESLKANKSVLIDLKGVDESVSGLISSLLLSKLAKMHKNKQLKGQTELIIDEAKTMTIPNLEEIITECRKDKLALTLIFQYLGQFDSQPKTKQAIENAIAHTYEFTNNHEAIRTKDTKEIRELPKFNFLYTYNGEIITRKILKVDFNKILREFSYTPKGEKREEIKKRMQEKLINIYKFFTENH